MLRETDTEKATDLWFYALAAVVINLNGVVRFGEWILSVRNKHFVYIIECNNGTYYTGYTTNVDRRYKEHENGSEKCKYTRSFPPKQLVLTIAFDSKSEALKKEAEIKQLSRDEKVKFIQKIIL